MAETCRKAAWMRLVGDGLGRRETGLFLSAVRARVHAEIEKPKVLRGGARRHYAKAALIIAWLVASYAAMLVAGGTVGVIAAGISAGAALAALAFNVQHDGGHGAFAESRRLNRIAAGVLDFLGTSSFLWRWKHNLLHHSAPNVDGRDDDVDAMPVLRLHPSQDWRPWHRYQHLYCWAVYPFLTIRWALLSDLLEVRKGRIGDYEFPAMNKSTIWGFWISKIQFVGWALVVPVLAHGWLGLVFFLVFELTGGFIAAVAFQLAHCVEEASHHSMDATVNMSWERLQLSSTVDFRAHAVVSWFLGGLNHQTVHHLFPGIRHTLYPQIAEFVRCEAMRHGLPYFCAPSIRYQIRSHYRFLRRLGQMPTDSKRAASPCVTTTGKHSVNQVS